MIVKDYTPLNKIAHVSTPAPGNTRRSRTASPYSGMPCKGMVDTEVTIQMPSEPLTPARIINGCRNWDIGM